MKITCQSCQSKYTVSDEKVQGKTVKIKCRKCGATILVNSSGVVSGGGAAEPAPALAATSPEASASYTVNVSDGDQRTMNVAEIVSAYQSSLVNADTYVWADGMADWLPISQVEPLVAALHELATADTGAPPDVATPMVAAPVAAVPASRGVAAPYVAPAPVTTEAPVEPRAAVRREATRRSDDLFSPARAAEAAAPMRNGASSFPPAARSSVGGGKGEENSMLFSLSALTAKVSEPRAISSGTKAAPKDDSGIIDLKALAESAAVQPVASDLAPTILPEGGLFGAPVTSPPVVAAPSTTSDLGPAPKSKSGMFVMVGAQ